MMTAWKCPRLAFGLGEKVAVVGGSGNGGPVGQGRLLGKMLPSSLGRHNIAFYPLGLKEVNTKGVLIRTLRGLFRPVNWGWEGILFYMQSHYLVCTYMLGSHRQGIMSSRMGRALRGVRRRCCVFCLFVCLFFTRRNILQRDVVDLGCNNRVSSFIQDGDHPEDRVYPQDNRLYYHKKHVNTIPMRNDVSQASITRSSKQRVSECVCVCTLQRFSYPPKSPSNPATKLANRSHQPFPVFFNFWPPVHPSIPRRFNRRLIKASLQKDIFAPLDIYNT